MDNTSYIALSRETALWNQLDVVANNMANVNTPGYKSEQVMFTSYPAKVQAANTPFGRMLDFTHDFGITRDPTEGTLTQTAAPLDLAIKGTGYFVLDTPSGPRYTRAGHFQLDDNGMITSSDGMPLMQANGQPIIVAPNETNITVAQDGTVSTENGQIGQLELVNFANEQDLHPAGDNSYDTTETPVPVTQPTIIQGMLEGSNVQPITEMTSMLNITRNYEGVLNMIQGESDRQMKAINDLSGANASQNA